VTQLQEDLKKSVHDHWNRESCGEGYAATDGEFDLSAQERERYALEPYLAPFAKFEEAPGSDVLEIGVGMGADHLRWARAGPKSLTGIDLTPRAVEFAHARIVAEGLSSNLRVGDAESLPFADNSFDIVYSWGVLHHSPNTERCFQEVRRVLRTDGRARVMVYHTRSLVGLMLWGRYGLLAGRPFRSMADIYHHHLESPGTKAYSRAECEAMFRRAGFSKVSVRIQLSHGDLLEGAVGARHRGALLSLVKRLWPRPFLRRIAVGWGLYLLIEAEK
jgi:ubiquinone/menaquinone biosynthesis C-methylase UbiE